MASPVPPAPSSVLFGTWANSNPATRNVEDIVISPGRAGILVDGFGACSPTPCQWGDIPGTVFGPNVSSPTGNSFRADWNFGFARTVIVGTVSQRLFFRPVLTVQEFTTFTDHSGRANFTVTETFVRARTSITPTRNGIPANNYPIGDPVTPVRALLGIWVNTSPSGNITKIILRRGPGRTLSVSAFGNCVPTACVWGRVTGITFGISIGSLTGQTFLAPYNFGFSNALLDGTLNSTGTRLIVGTYKEFTDHSGRSNYLSTDTFLRV
jgi:hypothetical protein